MSYFDEIKPSHFRKKIKSSLKETINKFMNTNPEFENVNCPFCKTDDFNVFFKIHEINFLKCNHCTSIYTSPRPTKESLKTFYNLNPTIDVDADMLPSVRKTRIDKVMRPRWNRIKEKLKGIGVKFPVNNVLEIGAGIGHFLEVVEESKISKNYHAVEPTQQCQEYLNKNKFLKSYELVFENLDEKLNSDVIFINSVIEHPHCLDTFFNKLNENLNADGVISLFDMHSNGADINVLKENSQNVNPLLILQIGSAKGIDILAKRHNMHVVHQSSEGELDIDIIYQYVKNLDSSHSLSGLKYLLSDEKLSANLQETLKDNLATGYNLYLIKKKN